jgi:hypothetical protein
VCGFVEAGGGEVLQISELNEDRGAWMRICRTFVESYNLVCCFWFRKEDKNEKAFCFFKHSYLF